RLVASGLIIENVRSIAIVQSFGSRESGRCLPARTSGNKGGWAISRRRHTSPEAIMEVEAAFEPLHDRIIARQRRWPSRHAHPLQGAKQDIIGKQRTISAEEGLEMQRAADRFQP